MMNLIDISSWQKGLDLQSLFAKNKDLDGVVVKATEGTAYVNLCCDEWVQTLKQLDKPWGFYHYLTGADPKAEAEYFYKSTKSYFGSGVPCADYEANALNAGTGYLKRFLDRVYELSGVRPLVYCSQSVTQSQDFTAIASAGYQLWMAQYADMNPVNGFVENPWHSGSVTPFSRYVMHQYTSDGHLDGWSGGLDFDKYYGSYSEWLETARGKNEVPTNGAPQKKSVTPAVVLDILHGKYGNGIERSTRLTEAGFNADECQRKVNELYAIGLSCKKYINGNMDYLNALIYIIKCL